MTLRRVEREERVLGDLEACNEKNASQEQRVVAFCRIFVVYLGKLRAARQIVEVEVAAGSRSVAVAAVLVVVE